MFTRIALVWSILAVTLADKDGKRWVWEDNSRSESRHRDGDLRYEVFENPDVQAPNRPFFGGGAGGEGGVGGGGGPIRPPIQNQRPGGLFVGGNFDGGYGQQQNYYPEEGPGGAGILTGPVPSWVQQGPFKNFDKCKCTEKFNCPSPGISYGHCDAGKQYCCFSTDKINQIGEPLPSRPVHSIENGILVGPGGPIDPVPGVNVNPRPPRPGNYLRPGGNYVRPGAAGFGVRPSYGSGNTYSAQNGILVGPGGPVDRPYRSAKKDN